MFSGMMLVGLLIDAAIGWPHWLLVRVGHPVTWIGRLISGCDARMNTGSRRRRLATGALTVMVLLAFTGLFAAALQALLPGGVAGLLLGGVLAWPLIAARSLHAHVLAVARPLREGDIEAARRAVSMIVGRDPARLDTAGLTRAATESLAENASDGVIAPVFWGVVAGLPGIAAYKAINTMDSMIGHRNARYEAFGKMAARLDDLVNWVPARLTGLLLALARPRTFGAAWSCMWGDARLHRSPNAGWPEAAMAGALGIRLSGPRHYGNRVADEPWVNAGAADPSAEDLVVALALYRRAVALLALALLALTLI
jgi:adenosylcobinamide-phosphate synthase